MRHILCVFLIVFGISFYSCEEIGPNINLTNNGGGNDTTGTVDSNQQKIILIEDFTATNCPNCPKATDIIEDLLEANPGRIEVIAVHQGPLSVPLEQGDPELKTQDGEDLASYLGPPPYWPCGAINRKWFEVSPGNFQRLIDRNYWTQYTEQELDSILKINLGLNFTYNDVSRSLTGSVKINYLQTITDALNITVLITENGIVAGQLDGIVHLTDYVHHHVLRDIITNFAGDIVTGEKTAGSSWTYTISPYTVPVEWNGDSCRVVAFVTKAIGDYDVLQAMGTPLN